ncbi:b2-microglobulin isoform X1 [Oryzias latipes]|uniref:Beta-2-microglobulin n=1 Tax=Oryzias latipes TaxID=8090 RepID=Q90ZJ6_ORYLA|nr:b2-microglobulin precursor [Oryzias latipes]XP_023807839.1 b2-microglobulin isoform X1 [Oryzias latipes]BAB60851.1 b2-microglobulin [Oryzias latipes]
MKELFFIAALAAFCCAAFSKTSPPTVQVYSRDPGQYGKENTLICHVSNFHPPDITIRLMEDDQELPEAKQTDLAFKQNWHFHLTKSAPFTPKQGARYTCKVTHSGLAKDYTWESNM